ncbi:MAG: haloacid dehalogenase-like hydrolase [Dehalococcoidales bacterium]|nr:haloacid dehalogenase-like hydrolase [Dehalococcoidales bacterium]
MRKYPIVALAYDFDGTLSPGNMQEHSFIPDIGIPSNKFWREADKLAKTHRADYVLAYMNYMLKKASEADVPVRRQDFIEHGESVKLFKGVKTWFKLINDYGKGLGLKVEHYIISSGLREMIEGTPIAHEFKMIYASSYKYNASEVAEWPALAINYTTKTQYLFRINKGALDICDNKKINAFVKMEERPIPFKRLIFIGDGETDIPCFSLVKNLGGHSIAVYKPKTPGAKGVAEQLIRDKRVNFIAPANYTNGSTISEVVKAIMVKISGDCTLELFGKQG